MAFAGNFASEKLYRYPRVIVTNELTDDFIKAASRLGISIRTILFDGCSVKAPNPFIANPSLCESRTGLSIIHLSPVRQQQESIYPEPVPLKRVAHPVTLSDGIPLLVFPTIRLNEIHINQISGNLPDIWDIVKDVQGQDRMKKDAVNAVREDDTITSIQRARTLGYLVGIGMRVIETAEIEARINALERVMNNKA
jgi:hypothetical protein